VPKPAGTVQGEKNPHAAEAAVPSIAHMDRTATSLRPPFASSMATKEALPYAGALGEGKKRSFLPAASFGRYTMSAYSGLP
jgi:hypothetical protein